MKNSIWIAAAACVAAGLPLAGAESYRFDDAELGFNFTVGTAGCSNRVFRTATPADMKMLKIDRQGTRTELTWKGHAVFGPDFTVVATLDQTGRDQYEYGFRWSGNTNGLPLQSIAFPQLVVPRTDKAFVFNPNSNGCVVEPDWKACKPGQCVAGARPRSVHFTATLEPDGTSWYLDQRGDARLRTTLFDARKGDRPGTAVLKSVCEMPNEPAPSGALPFNGAIARFTGGSWFDAAAIYRDWVRTQDWYRAARARDLSRLRDIGMWFWNRGRADHVIAPVERFQKDSGVPCALDWYWWHDIPYDTSFPNFWPPREGEDVFRAAVERCRKNGIFIQVYTNGMTWDWDDPSWSEGGAEGVLIKADGTPRATAFNRFNHHRLAFMCGTAQKYQARMRTLYKTLAETGLPGIYLDMIGNASYEPCYAQTHGHVPGGGAFNVEGNRAFVRNIQKDIPGVLLCTEDPTEAYLEVFESGIALMCNYERFGSGNDRRRFVPAHQAVYHGCAALFGSYAMVHGIPPFDEKWPTDGKWKQEQAWEKLFPDQFAVELTRGVVWGMQPMVHNFLLENVTDPRYADDYRLMVDTARFYHANRDLLFDGEMLSPGRLDCATKKADFMIRGTYAREGEYRVCTRTNLLAVMHSVWRAPNGRTAAVLFNWTREPQTFALATPEIKASGTIPPRAWKLVEKFRGSETARKAARDFIDNEKQFHLGFLPTEQSNPITATLEADFRRSTLAGVQCLQRGDRQIPITMRHVFAGERYAKLVDAMVDTLRAPKGRIIFSGCGATGRLSILLESMWRDFFHRRAAELSPEERRLAGRSASIMTGGDFALIKSVEFFEDFAEGGRRQAKALDVGEGDTFVAITEGGETSSVLGTLEYAAEHGAKCFLVFNNPADLLRGYLDRCRKAIDDPRVTVLDIYCGSMSVAGSTRMQATSSEQLLGSCALEAALCRLMPRFRKETAKDYTVAFEKLLAGLESPGGRAGLVKAIEFEKGVYAQHGRITYLADDCMLDLFTDNTERSPTFMLPPLRSRRDLHLPQSWAFVKNPLHPTEACWSEMMRRHPRCLDFTADDARSLKMPQKFIDHPPLIKYSDLVTYMIGNEPAPERIKGYDRAAAVILTVGDRPAPYLAAADKLAAAWPERVYFHIGPQSSTASVGQNCIWVDMPIDRSPLEIWKHLAVKLAFNNLSTGTMAASGRVAGNWMSWVSVSNKKLIDRGIRLLVELGGVSYEEAAERLFTAEEWVSSQNWGAQEVPCAVQVALKRLREGK